MLTLASGYSFCPLSDAYVRSFLYLLYTLIKLYYTTGLSNQASSLAPDWILLLQRPRIPASFMVQQQHFDFLLHCVSTYVCIWRIHTYANFFWCACKYTYICNYPCKCSLVISGWWDFSIFSKISTINVHFLIIIKNRKWFSYL